MTTQVANIRTLPRPLPPGHVYIGRAAARANIEASPFGNPFRIGDPHPQHGGSMTRDEALILYEAWLWQQIRSGVITRADLLALRGMTLVCWCKPDPCHGDLLAGLIDMDEEAFAAWLAG